MAEVSIGGVFFPALLLWGVIAYVLSAVIRRALGWIGLYQFVWHRALFDLSLYVLLLGGTVAVASRVFGP